MLLLKKNEDVDNSTSSFFLHFYSGQNFKITKNERIDVYEHS